MKTIALNQVAVSPGKIWNNLKSKIIFSPSAIRTSSDLKKEKIDSMLSIVAALHQNALDHGTDNLTMDEINAEIAEMRRQRRKTKAIL